MADSARPREAWLSAWQREPESSFPLEEVEKSGSRYLRRHQTAASAVAANFDKEQQQEVGAGVGVLASKKAMRDCSHRRGGHQAGWLAD